MPEVYTGKVLIPGDQIDDYLVALKEAEEARAPFRQSLEDLNVAFAASLDKKYSRRTVLKHTSVVDLFIIFLSDYTDVERLEDVTRGMVNSHFRRWYRGKVLDRMDADETRVALRKFFQFLDQERDIHNPKVLEALR
jgi:site-specific recombinase XerD